MKGQGGASEAEPAVSIIIVSWNTREILRDCIASIVRETSLPHEIIVVDNGSADGSQDMIRDTYPDVTLIANSDNRGFAAANNQGLEIATGGKLLLLNPDTVILDRAVDRMAGWLDAHPDVGCAGCQVWENEQTIQRTGFADPGPFHLTLVEFGIQRLAPRHPVIGRPEYGGWDRCNERDVDVVTGMFMLVPRQVFEQVGGLDEDFFVYSEEADWCRRIRAAGWRCVFTPVARILHLDGGSKSTSQIRSRMYVQLQKSKMIYLRKHHGSAGALAGRLIFLGSALLKFTLSFLHRQEEGAARRRLTRASLWFHLTGKEPST